MSPEALAVIGTLAGAAIGSLSTLAITWINKRSEERKHRSSLVMNAAIENYKQYAQVIMQEGGRVRPLDDYTIHMSKVAGLIAKENITPDDIDKVYGEAEALQRRLNERKEKLINGEQP